MIYDKGNRRRELFNHLGWGVVLMLIGLLAKFFLPITWLQAFSIHLLYLVFSSGIAIVYYIIVFLVWLAETIGEFLDNLFRRK